MNVSLIERRGETTPGYTWLCECVCTFMRGIRSTFIQDKCALSLCPVSHSLSLTSFCLFSWFSKEINQVSGWGTMKEIKAIQSYKIVLTTERLQPWGLIHTAQLWLVHMCSSVKVRKKKHDADSLFFHPHIHKEINCLPLSLPPTHTHTHTHTPSSLCLTQLYDHSFGKGSEEWLRFLHQQLVHLFTAISTLIKLFPYTG